MLYKLQDFLNEVKYFYQRVTRGYDDPSWWNLNNHVVESALKPLKHLRKENNGHPMVHTTKEWNKILDEIIWSFETFLKDDFDYSKKKWRKDYDRMQKGFELFGKYLLNLWD